MKRRRAALALWVTVLFSTVAWTPARARSVEGVKRELKKVEGQLQAGEWDLARAACDESMHDLLQAYARGKGARPIYGLILAFRALAEAGLGDEKAATWDWTAAGELSPEATRFDLLRYGSAGQALRQALDSQPVAIETPGPIEPRGTIANPVPPVTPTSRLYEYKCSIKVFMVIDAEGQPVRIRKTEGNCMDEHTALAVLTMETERGWRFEPVERDGKSVAVNYWFETTFERTTKR